MNCDSLQDRIPDLAQQAVGGEEWKQCMAHVDGCPDCRAALRGAEALVRIRGRDVDGVDQAMFERVMDAVTHERPRPGSRQRFLVGTLVGAAVAASIFGIAMYLGWSGVMRGTAPAEAEFVVAVGEPRRMDLAFETDRDLPGATISIVLSGDVEIAGYGAQRELSWAEDLEAGVNRLTLPVLASGAGGGRMVVRLDHPRSEQVLVVNLAARN